MREHVAQVAERVAQAAASRTPLEIRGGGTKRFLGNPAAGEPLEVGAIKGIVDHDPSELNVTVRGGTTVAETEAALAASGQMLGFEPPALGGAATVGGTVACGLSGPRRPAAGACRDFMLGATVVDGSGEVLRFGGKVIKNVAGFDVTRLLAGSMGSLGVIVEVTFRVVARPEAEATCVLELPQAHAIHRANELAGQGTVLSASCWHRDRLSVRLSGSESGVARCAREIGGERADGEASAGFWRSVRDQTHAFFAGDEPLWKLSLPAVADPVEAEGETMVEWHGALRWLRTRASPEEVRAKAAEAGGAAILYRAGPSLADFRGRFPELPETLGELHRRLTAVFDPAGILNPGRMR